MSPEATPLEPGRPAPLPAGAPGVVVALGWEGAVRRGLLGRGRTSEVDLDASCLTFDAAGRHRESAWFGQLEAHAGAIRHAGDDAGEAGPAEERIEADLAALPADVATLVFTVSAYRAKGFRDVAAASGRVLDAATGAELARCEVPAGGTHTAVVLLRLDRAPDAWTATAVGETGDGRTFKDLLPLVGRLVADRPAA